MKKTDKSERIIFLIIVIIQFLIILFYFLKIKNYQNVYNETSGYTKIDRLYSFIGTNNLGETELIHFTAYSDKFYVFAGFSSNCHYCNIFMKNFEEFLNREKIANDEINIVFISTDFIENEKIVNKFKFLRVNSEDIIQFDFDIPFLIVSNGKGDILYKYVGYSEKIFKEAFSQIEKLKYKKSEILSE